MARFLKPLAYNEWRGVFYEKSCMQCATVLNCKLNCYSVFLYANYSNKTSVLSFKHYEINQKMMNATKSFLKSKVTKLNQQFSQNDIGTTILAVQQLKVSESVRFSNQSNYRCFASYKTMLKITKLIGNNSSIQMGVLGHFTTCDTFWYRRIGVFCPKYSD